MKRIFRLKFRTIEPGTGHNFMSQTSLFIMVSNFGIYRALHGISIRQFIINTWPIQRTCQQCKDGETYRSEDCKFDSIMLL